MMAILKTTTDLEIEFLRSLINHGKFTAFRNYAQIVLEDRRRYDRDVDVLAIKRFIKGALAEIEVESFNPSPNDMAKVWEEERG